MAVFASCFMCGYLWYVWMEGVGQDSSAPIMASCTLIFFINILSLFPPISSGKTELTKKNYLYSISLLPATMTLVLQCFYCMEAGLQHYVDLTGALMSREKVQAVANIGMELNSLLEDTNSVFGDLIVCEYGVNLIGSTLCLFTSLSLANVYHEV